MRDLLTKIVCKEKDLTSTTVIEESIDLVGNVIKMQIFAKQTATAKAIQQNITQIFLEPNGLTPVLDINGQDGLAIMKSKFAGTCNKPTASCPTQILYEFNFTDYAGKLNLSIPASCKSMTFRMTASADMKVTVVIVQDLGLASSQGYRKYYSKTKVVEKSANEIESMPLPFSGILDSIWAIFTEGTETGQMEFDDINIEKDDDKYPYKSTVELADMSANLNNDEAYAVTSSGDIGDFAAKVRYLYLDLARPIDAQDAKSLRFNGKIKSKNGANNLRILYEYVHLL